MSARSDFDLPLGGWSVAGNAVGLASLGLLVWGVLSELHTLGSTGQRATAVALLAAAVASWLVWMYLRSRLERASVAALFAMAVTGGALVGFTPVAMVFPGLAVLSAASQWRVGVAALVGAAGWLAMAVGVLAEGRPAGVLLGGLAAVLGGAVVGITRRQAVERTEQLARMEVEVARTEVERARAELLGERNHLAREIHDVLAHTLAALSLQLEAFGTVVEADPDTSSAVREQLERTRMLVHEGLDEARGAVRALRDEPAPLGEQLTKLSAQQHAAFTESGAPAPLPAPVVLGLYRVAQEALTNVMKHAPGASGVGGPDLVARGQSRSASKTMPVASPRPPCWAGVAAGRVCAASPSASSSWGARSSRGRRHRAGASPLRCRSAASSHRPSAQKRRREGPHRRRPEGRAGGPGDHRGRVPRHRGRGSGRGRRRGPGARRGTGSRRGADGPAHAPDGRRGRHPGRAGAAPRPSRSSS